MIYILNIGYQSFAFSSSRGLQTVLETLSKARQLDSHYHPRLDRAEDLKMKGEDPEVSLHVVAGVSFVKGGSRRRDVIEPEVMPRETTGRRAMGDAEMAVRAVEARMLKPGERMRYALPSPGEWGRVTSGKGGA